MSDFLHFLFISHTAIRVGFSITEFTVNEDAGIQNNLIFVTKMNNVVTEQTLLFVIELSTSTAMSGQC